MRSLRTQITLSAALLTVIAVALSGLVIAIRIDHQDRAQVDRLLRARAAKVQSDTGKAGGVLLPQNDGRGDANLLAGTDTLTRVYSDGELVAQSGEGASPAPVREGLSTVTIDGQDWRSLVEPTRAVSAGELQVLQSLAPVEQRLHDNGRLIALVAVVASLITALAAWLVSGLVLRPLQRLRHAAAAIRPGAGRLPDVGGQQEIAELAATLNGMLERLELSTNSTRRFTADAGHELRTPLAALGMDLETLRRNPELPSAEILDAMTHEHARMVALLDGLQQLARGDAEALPKRTRVDLAAIAETAVEAARRRHRGVTFRLVASPGSVDGWEDGIRLALDNLLDNAALHGGVTVDVTVGDGQITVDDDGPGIAAADRERLKQRFARGADPRGAGSGLGLALVDQQARLHGGTLNLADAPAGGLRATLSMSRR